LGKGISVAGRKTIRLEDYLPYLINRVGAVLVARFSADALASRNLSIDGWRVLAVLSNSGKQRQIDLAGLASIDPSTLSRLVARLARKGLVTRLRSRTSSREVEVQLTAKGRTAVRKLIPVAIETERLAASGISAAQIAVVKRALHIMYRNLDTGRSRENTRNGGVGRSRALVNDTHRFRDAGRLVAAFDVERAEKDELEAVSGRLDRSQRLTHANTVAGHDRRGETHFLQAVIDPARDGVQPPDLVTQMRDQRQRQKAVRNRTALRHFAGCTLDVDVNPLIVAGDFREGVDAR
jgi:MarR family transcriptional regulator, organic hydroperoxide resistance regulator